jgi:signal transduction histidine kinase
VKRDLCYSDEQQLLLQEIASRAALKIENASLYAAAEDAIRVRDQFISVAGHELITPVAAAQLQLQNVSNILKRRREDFDLGFVIGRVQQGIGNLHRLGRLVNELIDVTRITTAHLQLEHQEVDLTALVTKAIAWISEAAISSGSWTSSRHRRWWGSGIRSASNRWSRTC